MGKGGSDPSRGDDHVRVGARVRRCGPAREAAGTAADLPQPGHSQPRERDQHGPPHRVGQPDQPRHRLHRGVERGEHPREVGVRDGQHRAQPEQSPDQPQHHHGRSTGELDRRGNEIHPTPVALFTRALGPGFPLGELVVVPDRLRRAHLPLVAGVRARLPPRRVSTHAPTSTYTAMLRTNHRSDLSRSSG